MNNRQSVPKNILILLDFLLSLQFAGFFLSIITIIITIIVIISYCYYIIF